MYKNRQDNDPPIEKLSTRPRTVRHRSKPTKSLRPARAILTGWKRIVRHTDNRITRVSPMLLRENPVSSSSSSTFPPSPLRRKSEPNRGASITRKDRNDEGRHVHVPIAHAGYRIRRARLPPPCSNRSAGVLLRGASRGCSQLQVHLALPPIRVERRRAFRRRAL